MYANFQFGYTYLSIKNINWLQKWLTIRTSKVVCKAKLDASLTITINY